MADEETPLLGNQNGEYNDAFREDRHKQFCLLIGMHPSDLPKGTESFPLSKSKLYERAKAKRGAQNLTYQFTAALSNFLLLSQVVLSATVTALGASDSSYVLITLFGVLTTIVAGLTAWLKSRGQPMRARMFRDDLDRVVDEIENSETMWHGVSRKVHGYHEIDADGDVSVRSEVARLTRLYDHAVKNNTQNNPDMYMAYGGGDVVANAKGKPQPGQPSVPGLHAAAPPIPGSNSIGATGGVTPPSRVIDDADESPATAKPKPSTADSKESNKNAATSTTPLESKHDSQQDVSGTDPDAEPATAKPKPKEGPMDAESNSDRAEESDKNRD
ncbi:MAG: hypothetical protein M1820_007366 [Bogoriella megaspora]|nr:MAG: hypothetical protein M1820_007366 [Bogoriella megaspora]